MTWETVVGLEVHVQLATRTKLLCGCEVEFGAPPNARTCPTCAGQPGALPVLNAAAVQLAARVGLALGAEVHAHSAFARKHYHYVDLPKGYQITQADRPLCTGGELPLEGGGGGGGAAPLERIHLEEDAGKALHDGDASLVDLNRAGVPLIEVVGRPTLASAQEAVAALRSLRELVRWVGASRADMERGELRCDVNVSLRRPGAPLGQRVEVKNLNSFRHVAAAIEHEAARQASVLEGGDPVAQETRLFDPDTGQTRAMRAKEDAQDYRLFPEPDLPPLRLTAAELDAQRGMLPELPPARRARYAATLGLSEYDAGVLTTERAVADWFEAVVRAGANAKAAANWVSNELLGALADEDVPAAHLDDLPLGPRDLATLLELVGEGALSTRAAREVFGALVRRGGDPRTLVDELGLTPVREAGAVEAWCRAAIEADPAAADAVRRGNPKALGALIGPALEHSGGRADPSHVRATLERLLT